MITGRTIFRVAVGMIVVAVLLLGVRVYHHAHKAHLLAEIITCSHTLSSKIQAYCRRTGSYPIDLQAVIDPADTPQDYRRWFSADVQIIYTKPSGVSGVESRMLVVDYDDHEIIYDSGFVRTVRAKR